MILVNTNDNNGGRDNEKNTSQNNSSSDILRMQHIPTATSNDVHETWRFGPSSLWPGVFVQNLYAVKITNRTLSQTR